MSARYHARATRVGCDDTELDGVFDFLKKGFLEVFGLKDEAEDLAAKISKMLPNELEDLANLVAPYAAKLLPPPYGTAAKAYMMFQRAVQAGQYEVGAQIQDLLKQYGLPDPMDLIRDAGGTVDDVRTTARMGAELVRLAGSLALAGAAIGTGALVVSQLPRARRFRGTFKKRRR